MEKEGKDRAVSLLAQRSGLREQLKGPRLWLCPRARRIVEEEGSKQAILDVSLQEFP